MIHLWYLKNGTNLKILSLIFDQPKNIIQLGKAMQIEESTIRARLSEMIRHKEVKAKVINGKKHYSAVIHSGMMTSCARCDGKRLVGRKRIVCLDCGRIFTREEFKLISCDMPWNYADAKQTVKLEEAVRVKN